MALVQQGYTVNITVADSAGDRASRSYGVLGATIADALTNAQSIVAEFDPLTEGVILGWTLCVRFVEDAFTYPAGGVEVENQAEILGRIANVPNKSAAFNVPAAAGGIFVGTTGPNRNIVDGADADVLAFLALFDETGGIATISDGEQLDDAAPFVSGKRVHAKSRLG